MGPSTHFLSMPHRNIPSFHRKRSGPLNHVSPCFGQTTSSAPQGNISKKRPPAIPIRQWIESFKVYPVQTKNLQTHVNRLVQFPRAFETPEGLDAAAHYIQSQWVDQGYQVFEQPFQVQGKRFKNIWVSLGPPMADRIIVGAHYDVCAYAPRQSLRDAKDRIHVQYNFHSHLPGADDNGSGVAALLELTRLLKPLGSQFKTRIDFVAFTLEEPPNFGTRHMGSAHHAQFAFDDARQHWAQVKGMIALDMMGYYDDRDKSQTYPLPELIHRFGNRGNFLAVLGSERARPWIEHVKDLFSAQKRLPVVALSAQGEALEGIDFSDHRNYDQLGIPALMITDTAYFRNPNYHQETDTPDTLDYHRLALAVRGLQGALIRLGKQGETHYF